MVISNGRTVPTVYDVAARAGVSIATVSRVLRRPDAVLPATSDLVLAAVRELGYVPSGSARGLAARRSGAIGFCFPRFDDDDPEPVPLVSGSPDFRPVSVRVDPVDGEDSSVSLYMSEVMHGVELESWRHGMSATIAVARGERTGDAPGDVLDDLATRVDGIVVLAGTAGPERLAEVARSRPVVVLAGPRMGDSHDHVRTANLEGMRVLTEHLLSAHGLRELAFIAGTAEVPDDAERFAGFRAALAAAGLDVPTDPLLRGDFTQARARELSRDLLAGGHLPEAFVCANDQTALGVMQALGEIGVRVPEDVAVTGFDGIDAGRHSRPRVTTVRQPMIELGRVAVNLLLRRLADPGADPVERVLPVEVRLRESCGCPPVP